MTGRRGPVPTSTSAQTFGGVDVDVSKLRRLGHSLEYSSSVCPGCNVAGPKLAAYGYPPCPSPR